MLEVNALEWQELCRRGEVKGSPVFHICVPYFHVVQLYYFLRLMTLFYEK